MRRAAQHVRHALLEDFAWMQEERGKLVQRATLERAIGQLTFRASFLSYGRAKPNSTYAALAGARHLQCLQGLAMIHMDMA